MAKKSSAGKSSEGGVPGTFKAFITKRPALGKAHEQVAKAVDGAGLLDAETLTLIKIGICIDSGLESALRSHLRRAMQHGAMDKEVEQAILLGMNTVGFPRTVASWSWAQPQFRRGSGRALRRTPAR
ncbi:MAG: carboxymuconolactone decarboxylase family protein [Phycisphaerales bacterium]